METLSALAQLHVKVADSPKTITSGIAESVTVGSGTITVTVTFAEAFPPGPVAVIVYLVVTFGVTTVVPLISTLPISGSMTHVIALRYMSMKMRHFIQ